MIALRTEQGRRFGNTDGTDCFQGRRGDFEMSEGVKSGTVKKINPPVIGSSELQQADLIVFFVDGGQIADAGPAELPVVEEFVQGVFEFLGGRASVAAYADYQVTRPEDRTIRSKSGAMGNDQIRLIRRIDLLHACR